MPFNCRPTTLDLPLSRPRLAAILLIYPLTSSLFLNTAFEGQGLPGFFAVGLRQLNEGYAAHLADDSDN